MIYLLDLITLTAHIPVLAVFTWARILETKIAVYSKSNLSFENTWPDV